MVANKAASPTSPAALDPKTEATLVGDIWTAIANYFKGRGDVEQAVKHEFSQLIEDIHSYYVQYRAGQLSQDETQLLITQSRHEVPAILAYRTQLQADLAQKASNDAIRIIQEAITTVLSAAFSGFKFAL